MSDYIPLFRVLELLPGFVCLLVTNPSLCLVLSLVAAAPFSACLDFCSFWALPVSLLRPCILFSLDFCSFLILCLLSGPQLILNLNNINREVLRNFISQMDNLTFSRRRSWYNSEFTPCFHFLSMFPQNSTEFTPCSPPCFNFLQIYVELQRILKVIQTFSATI